MAETHTGAVRSAPASPTPVAQRGMAAPGIPTSALHVENQGQIRSPYNIPGKPANYGNDRYFSRGGTLPSGVSMGATGVPTAQNTSFAGKNDTVLSWPDGHKTVLMANGLSVDVPVAHAEERAGGHGGGGGGGGMPAAAGANAPTKVLGPKTAKDLLPAFSPPAINQFPNFYDPGAYRPVAGSTLPAGYTGPTNPDIGNQAALAQRMGVPWSAQSLTLTPGQNGYGMPAGNNLKNNFVDPRVYGYIAPTLNPAFYQNARSSAK